MAQHRLMMNAWASQVVLVIKNLPANAGDIRNAGLIPGLERSLEEAMTTHSSILAWRIPWTEELVCSTVSQGVVHAEMTSTHPWWMLKKTERHVAGLRLPCLVYKNTGTFWGYFCITLHNHWLRCWLLTKKCPLWPLVVRTTGIG